MDCSTIKIKATDPEQGAFVVINESDFDAEKHELYVEAPAVVEPEVAAEKHTKKK